MNKNETGEQYQNVIGKDATLSGEISFPEDTYIDGVIEGNLTIKGSVYVGENAVIKANISATDVTSEGTIKGNIVCEGTLTLLHTARVTGDIQTSLLKVEEGAIVQAKISMQKKNEKAEMLPPIENPAPKRNQ